MQFIDVDDDNPGYHPGLWSHVASNFRSGEWDRVATGTAVYLEDYFRERMRSPKDKEDRPLNSSNLFELTVSDKYFPLGSHRGQRQGWRNLASGFVSATSNTNRHEIQKRSDLRNYAMGVLGLGSLLLTQFVYEHPDAAFQRPAIDWEPWDPSREDGRVPEYELLPPHSVAWKEFRDEWSKRDHQAQEELSVHPTSES